MLFVVAQIEGSRGRPADSKPVIVLQVHRWNCEACGVGYELGSIESALVAAVQQQERAYQLQDLQCTKCKNVSSDMDLVPWLMQQPARTQLLSQC